MACNSGPDIIEDGLVLCLDAGNKRSYPGSGTTWTDLAGANDGALTNMNGANFSSDNGGSLTFDGTNEHVTVGQLDSYSFIQNTAVFSIAATIKLDALLRINPIAISTTATAEKGFYFRVETDNRVVIAARRGVSGASVFGIKSTTQLIANRFYQVVATGDGSQVRLFIDSVEDVVTGNPSQSVGTLSSGDSSRILLLARNPTAASQVLNGDIFNVSIYNRTLTADEIRQNYEATVGRYT
jgi:hypothetical protein